VKRALALAALLAATPGIAAPAPHWVGSWASAQQTPEPANALPAASDTTLRQVVHVSLGGATLRVRFSNAFGGAPLVIDAATVARAAGPGGSALLPGTLRPLSFAGRAGVTIPAGADYWSDPVTLPLPALSDLAVSLHLPAPPLAQTGHPGSRATSYWLTGNHVREERLAGAATLDHWYDLAGVEVASPARAAAIVTLGDSITDGHGATTNGNDRWPDALARRLAENPATREMAVLNEGIGGNRLLLDGLGPNALARFDRDVLAQAGVTTLVLLEGINDLGTLTRNHPVSPAEHQTLVAAILGAYAQIVERAHAHGICVIGGTVTPDGGSDYYHPSPENEADRQAVNAWIRSPGHFDAVADFDAALRDPADPSRLRRGYDSGDHLHPSPAGYRAMAASIPLKLLATARRSPAGEDGAASR
jgi:lysophospholipase L1-like esterase